MFLVADIEQVDMADTQLIILFHCLFCSLVDGRTLSSAARRDDDRVDERRKVRDQIDRFLLPVRKILLRGCHI